MRLLKHVVRFILLFLTIVGAASPAAANRVSSATTDGVGRSFSYDARGNVTDDGRNTFYYNLTNQPVSVTGSVTAAYVYDANLKRVKEVRNGATVYTIYSRVTGGLVMRDDLGAGVKTDYGETSRLTAFAVGAGLANVSVNKTGAVFTPTVQSNYDQSNYEWYRLLVSNQRPLDPQLSALARVIWIFARSSILCSISMDYVADSNSPQNHSRG